MNNVNAYSDMYFGVHALILGRYQCNKMIDVGLGKFMYSDFWKNLFQKIVAYEPDPFRYAEMEKEIHLPKHNFLTLKNKALSDFVGQTNMSVNLDYPSLSTLSYDKVREQELPMWNNFQLHEVEVTTIDNEHKLDNDIDFIKIDAERHDNQVLVGAEKTIQRNKPLVHVEHYTKHTKHILDNYNYHSFVPYGIKRLGMWAVSNDKMQIFKNNDYKDIVYE